MNKARVADVGAFEIQHVKLGEPLEIAQPGIADAGF